MKIAVAVSGGVDSTACLLKLKEQNHDLIALTMYLRQTCESIDMDNAKKICKDIGVKHYTLNLSDVFKDKIYNYFINEYLSARTPNPCMICNPEIKFGVLRDYALSLGYPYIATGHYVRKVRIGSAYFIQKGKDELKDQSYFISRIGSERLNYAIFPLGEMTKDQVRDYISQKKLSIKKTAESQEICFIPNDDYREFIKNKTPKDKIREGDILDESGNVVGRHKGVAFYTIGQRRGVNVAMGKPVYIREINPQKNIIIVGDKKRSNTFLAKDTIYYKPPEELLNKKLYVKIRYRGKPQPCKITNHQDGNIKVETNDYISSVTPGQGAVFYENDLIVASSIIDC